MDTVNEALDAMFAVGSIAKGVGIAALVASLTGWAVALAATGGTTDALETWDNGRTQ
jgi:hypothetical protein